MISKEQIDGIIREVADKGYRVNIKDISAVLLADIFEEKDHILKTIFGDGSKKTVETYFGLNKVAALKEVLESHRVKDNEDVKPIPKLDNQYVGMTFEELKKGMEDDLRALIKLRDNTQLDNQDMVQVTKQIADLRLKLSTKMGSTEQKQESKVVVLQRFNAVCPICNHEISVRRD